LKWLNDLKIAVIEENIEKIEKLMNQFPNSFDDLAKANEALALTKKAIELVEIEKSKTLKEMKKIKKIKEFVLNS